ncbi:hypothetical protein BKA81DRAFT_421400 [Phyllosticta paracitricarpa]|uniref:Uncharacterized protein n=1 Tax=Phyllosticta paracitricarpa TaxID=2016321 RepID=A0ABR1MXY5_9PEZI
MSGMKSGYHGATRHCEATKKFGTTKDHQPIQDHWIFEDDEALPASPTQSHHDLQSQRRANRSHQVGTGCEDSEISPLEAEILNAVGFQVEPGDVDANPETTKVWWRNETLKSLEGDSHRVVEQAKDLNGESNGEEENEDEDQAKARRLCDTAKALEALEGRDLGHTTRVRLQEVIVIDKVLQPFGERNSLGRPQISTPSRSAMHYHDLTGPSVGTLPRLSELRQKI